MNLAFDSLIKLFCILAIFLITGCSSSTSNKDEETVVQSIDSEYILDTEHTQDSSEESVLLSTHYDGDDYQSDTEYEENSTEEYYHKQSDDSEDMEVPTKRVTCSICYGTSGCNVCGGTGRMYSFGEWIECSSCGGTGFCGFCNGTGFIEEVGW